jgi:septal ring factor EnvC (AmiA/AmiB activator)
MTEHPSVQKIKNPLPFSNLTKLTEQMAQVQKQLAEINLKLKEADEDIKHLYSCIDDINGTSDTSHL